MVEVYIYDIIFGINDGNINQEFVLKMKKEFEMSMLGELSFFLELQISQLKDDVHVSHTKYVKEMLKRFNMEDYKPICTPMVMGCKLS